ncbi:hypothetical protein [Niabella ginsengisoli]|nr:hypothetical protein [Niabella ginsengisoli]
MLIVFFALASNAQTLTITGQVTDVEGKPLSGVSVEAPVLL